MSLELKLQSRFSGAESHQDSETLGHLDNFCDGTLLILRAQVNVNHADCVLVIHLTRVSEDNAVNP